MTATRKSARVLDEAARPHTGKGSRARNNDPVWLTGRSAAKAASWLVSATDPLQSPHVAVPLPAELRAAVIAELKVARRNIDKLIAQVEATKAAS